MNNNWIYINKFIFGDLEKQKVNEVINGNWFAGNSKFNVEFENCIKRFANIKHFQLTNSGSSALEIAIQVLIQSGRIKPGDLFLHPLITFPTSLSSAVMAGLVPVFVDSDPGTYQISTEGIKQALQEYPGIKLAIIPALFGNIPDMDVLKESLGDRYLIVDSCDTIGSKWEDKEFISYGDMGAYSFYSSHHISTMVGGGLATNNDEFYELAKSMTFWGRDFSTDNLSLVENFLKRYTYRTLGLDAQLNSISAGIGLAQMEKLPDIIGRRKYVFTKLQKLFMTKLK